MIFSTHPEEIYALRAIKSGAAGYVPKSASSKILLKAINQIRKGGIFLNEELTSTFTTRNVGETSAISRYKNYPLEKLKYLTFYLAVRETKILLPHYPLMKKRLVLIKPDCSKN